MTAIAVAYVSAGFAVSAEGRQQWAHQPTRDRNIRADERDDVQKIFDVAGNQSILAYTVSGDIASRDRSFDLTVAVKDQVALLRDRRFWSAQRFVQTLAANLERGIEEAKRDGRTEDYPASEVLLLGYVRRRPCFFSIQFHRVGAGAGVGMVRRVIPHELQPGCCLLIGSQLIGNLVLSGDARFMRFCKPLDAKSSLQDCVAFVRGYVEACCSPLAQDLDPECRRIGGHIHIATLTPPDGSITSRVRTWFGSSNRDAAGGFHWVQPPGSRSRAETALPADTEQT